MREPEPVSPRQGVADGTTGVHRPQLDALRALAVLGVLLSHYMYRTEAVHAAGPWGVRLFFVLSGFLITGILLDCRSAIAVGQGIGFTLRQFYARRFLRIFPLYYATLLVAWLCGVPEVRANLGWHLAYLSNVHFALTGTWHFPLSHFWSLAVEEQFYLVWPPLLLLLPRRALVPVIVAAIAAAPLFRYVGTAAGLSQMAVWNLPFTALDSLGVGALLAVLVTRRPGGWLVDGRGLAWATVALLGVVVALSVPAMAERASLRWVQQAHLHDTVVSLAFGGVILGAVRGWRGPVGQVLSWGPLRYVGRVSYGVYVLHLFMQLVLPWLLTRLGLPYPTTEAGWERMLLLTAATIAAAALSWHLFEQPINALKRHFPYRPRAATPAAPPAAAPVAAIERRAVSG